ncbi:hypothetical protein ACFYST_06060 [Kitasatospora sp. NPDC004614]|uniref:hypothetical protein n=1 Tax=unclassified Kitasatospora TaxID=2633591 RepID=UPI003684B414
MVLTASFLSINGVDLSAYCKKVELKTEVDEKDITTYGSLGWKTVLGGIKSGSVSADFIQDFAATKLDSILWPLLGQVVPFEIRADQAAVGVNNPKYSGNVLIKEVNPLQGGVGDEATTGGSYPTSGAVTRATT